MLALMIVITAGALVVGAEPADELLGQTGAYSDREYAFDAMALEYLPDYVSDPAVVQEISRRYWCGTPVIEQWNRIAEAEKSEAVLRARAKRLATRYPREQI